MWRVLDSATWEQELPGDGLTRRSRHGWLWKNATGIRLPETRGKLDIKQNVTCILDVGCRHQLRGEWYESA